MLQAAVDKFAKSLGNEGSLIPVPSLDAAASCKPLYVVVKKNRRWFWQKPKYEPKKFLLQDLLVKNDPVNVTINSRPLVTYNQVHKFAVNGKIGANLKKFLDMKLSASDTINVEAKFGDVTKFEVDEPELIKCLEGRCLDLGHDLIHAIRKNPGKLLCLIVGNAVTSDGGTLHTHVTINGEDIFNVTKPIDSLAGGSTSGSVSDDDDKEFKVPKDTPLAYNLYELWVKSTGQIQVVLEKDLAGGFEEIDSVDGGLVEDLSLKDMFDGIVSLSADKRNQLTESVLEICSSPQDVETLLTTITDGCEAADNKQSKSVSLDELKKTLHSEDTAWKPLLESIGFSFQDTTVNFPEASSQLLESVRCLFEALFELDDDQTVALTKLNKNMAKPLVYLLQKALDDGSVELKGADKTQFNAEDNPGKAFIKSLDFQSENETLELSGSNDSEIHGAYRALFALWLNHEDLNDEEKSKWCVLV